VSLDAPLISNLTVWANIALIPQYHRNMPARDARALVDDLLGRLGMISISKKRNSALTMEERFCAMLLRAVMVRDAVIILDRPFTILSNLRDGGFIMEILQGFDDLIAESYIFDYTWEESRYRGTDGGEK
jgi:ABC-type lipopolysaccharide export system ATPase subunit